MGFHKPLLLSTLNFFKFKFKDFQGEAESVPIKCQQHAKKNTNPTSEPSTFQE